MGMGYIKQHYVTDNSLIQFYFKHSMVFVTSCQNCFNEPKYYSIALAHAVATCACQKSPNLRPVPAVTKPAILIMTSFATKAGPWALATPSVTDVWMPYHILKYRYNIKHQLNTA